MPGDASILSRITSGRDPPGQRCKYIYPGDPSKESYRLYTFVEFPKSSPANLRNLAAQGFYYTGYNDRAKCFSCGNCVHGWTSADNPGDPQFHKAGCEIVHGQGNRSVQSDSTSFRFLLNQYKAAAQQAANGINFQPNQMNANINYQSKQSPMEATDHVTASTRSHVTIRRTPLRLGEVLDPDHARLLRSLDLTKEEDRRKTFAKWPTYPTPYLVSALAKEGFFYLGNLDRVQCFSCSLVLRNWAPNDSVIEQHQRHSTSCSMAWGNETTNISLNEESRRRMDNEHRQHLDRILSNATTRDPPDPSPAEQQHLQKYLPCSNPVNPHMNSLQRRIDTFQNWPQNKTRATREEIAKAGFFYLGTADKTKCYYCNGGLQNWDFNDNPWIEHGKWFPGCEFVLRTKGVEFVRKLAAEHPNLNRPTIRNPVSWSRIPPFVASQSEHQTQAHSPVDEPMDVAGPSNSIQSLNPTTMHETTTVKVREAPSMSENSELSGSLLSDVQEMERNLLCRVCGIEKTGALVLPCAHLCCCHNCVGNVKTCPVCKTKVREFMKVYRA